LYEDLPSIDFSREILEPTVVNLALLPVRDIDWTDLGKPARVARTLGSLRIQQKWASVTIGTNVGPDGDSITDSKQLSAASHSRGHSHQRLVWILLRIKLEFERQKCLTEGTGMNQATDSLIDYSSGLILPLQYNDLARRRSSGFEGERRLLWAVLEDAIDTYLANMGCATAKQRNEFDEICGWFYAPKDQPAGLFSFESICDLLEIDAPSLLKGIESIREREMSREMKPAQMVLRLGRLAA
jgi:hypothetical protein